jgi:tight adherence protein B
VGALLGLLLGVGLLLVLRRGGPRPSVAGARLADWRRRRTELLRQAGIEGITPAQLLAIQLLAGLLLATVVLALTRSTGIACCTGLYGVAAPVGLVRRARRRRAVDLRELWPDAVDNLASGVRAGLSLPEALAALGERGPEPLRPAFDAFGADHRSSGRVAECLDRLKERLADPVADRVVETVRLAGEVGGTDLGIVLRALSAFLREDARTRAELEARQSWTVNAARLAVCAPWLVLLLLATQPTTLDAYDSRGGILVLAAGGLACVVAYRLMVRIGRLPAERRLLR